MSILTPSYPGLIVAVDNGDHPQWAGKVTRVGMFDTSPLLVVVVDPLDSRLIPGQYLIVLPRHVRPVFRRRWAPQLAFGSPPRMVARSVESRSSTDPTVAV